MSHPSDNLILRTRDFWSALVLMALSLFFLWKTSAIPLFGDNRAGVSGADWYTSAALVPLGIFGGLFILSLTLLAISIRAGGAKMALSSVGIGWDKTETARVACLCAIMLGFIAGLVPRVDFLISSGLAITALIYGFRGAWPTRMRLATGAVLLPACYAVAANMPQSRWNRHDDDIVTLVFWISLTALILLRAHREPALRIIPVIAVLAPLVLVCAMAFGFRQNVPARGGLIFAQIEYHYYVTLRPLWRR